MLGHAFNAQPETIDPGIRSHALKILVLSPHRDDAAFSLSIAITNWLTARHSVTVLNVFTRSRYAPFSDAAFVHENDELSYVSAMRLREDEYFLRRITQAPSQGPQIEPAHGRPQPEGRAHPSPLLP